MLRQHLVTFAALRSFCFDGSVQALIMKFLLRPAAPYWMPLWLAPAADLGLGDVHWLWRAYEDDPLSREDWHEHVAVETQEMATLSETLAALAADAANVQAQMESRFAAFRLPAPPHLPFQLLLQPRRARSP